MERSSSNMVLRVRSITNIGKKKYSYRYTLQPMVLEDMPATSDIVLVWERSGSVIATRPIPMRAGAGNYVEFADSDVLEDDVPMVKRTTTKYQTKEYKISVRAHSAQGKPLGHVYLDFANFAGRSEIITTNLSNDAILTMRMSSRLNRKRNEQGQEAKSTPIEKKGASYAKPSAAGIDQISNGDDYIPVVVLDEVPKTPVNNMVPTDSFRISRNSDDDDEEEDENGIHDERKFDKEGFPSYTSDYVENRSNDKEIDTEDKDDASDMSSDDEKDKGQRAVDPQVESLKGEIRQLRANGEKMAAENENMAAKNDRIAADTVQMAVEMGELAAENERIGAENSALTAENEELRVENEGLKSLEDIRKQVEVESLRDQNERLMMRISELRLQLRREPVAKDVMDELKKSKLTIALLAQQKAQLGF